MGTRGPGARSVKRPKRDAAPEPLQRPWDAPGLSRAERMIAFIETLKITSGPHAGRNFVLRPWQKEIIEDWYRTDADGRRIVRTGVLSMGRKNGKSTLVSAIALGHLIGPEREPRGQVVVAASDRDQSGIIFSELESMLEADEAMRDLVTIKLHEKVIIELELKSTFRSLSSDAKKSHGLSPSVVILDELAQWGSGVGVRLYNALMTAGGGRAEPLKLIISTQSDDDLSKMSELIDYGQQVNEGVIDDPTFSCRVFEVPEGLDPFDEQHWHLANPALGDFRTLEDMRELAGRARRMPTERAAFENLYCNRRVAADERWITKPDWDACRGEIDADALAGKLCFGGLDLGSVSDLTSFSLYWPDSGALLSWSWCPADRIAERSERDRVPYDVWAKERLIEATPGKAVDKRAVAMRLAELNALYRPLQIGFDAWGTPELLRIMTEEGIELPLSEVRQGYVTLSPAAKAFEELVLNQRLRHSANPVLTWAMSNVRLERDSAGNIKPSKAKSREKIDPIVAGVMAVGLATAYLKQADTRAFAAAEIEGMFDAA